MLALNSASAPCRRLISKRATRCLATEAPLPSPAPEAAKSKAKANINAAIILNRSPFLTKTPTPFERAYYAYQARIRRALHNPFPYDFYFKQGSLLETRFNMEERKRERKAFGPKFAPEDVISTESEEAMAAVELLRQQESEGQEFASRTSKADIDQDLKSLDRQGQRNLYLLLREKQAGRERWRFPQGDVEKGEVLHQAAQRDLHDECGANMDTWIVSRNPIGVYKGTSGAADSASQQQPTFFFKGHILAGQVELQSSQISDFAWLTKEEIEKRTDADYWDGVKDMLSDH